MKTAIQQARLPQVHSSDYQIRIKASELISIVFEHLCSVQEGSICADSHSTVGASCGITEWQGSFGCHAISLSWDWKLGPKGEVSLLRDVAPRTNLKIVDAKGYDVADEEAAPHLWARIGGLHWQSAVRDALDPLAITSRH